MADNKLNPMLEQDEAIDSYFNDLLFTLDESQAEKPGSQGFGTRDWSARF
mgnify:CR=1 FL=1